MERIILLVMTGLAMAGFGWMIAARAIDGRQPEPPTSEAEPPMLVPNVGTLRLAVYSRIAVFGGMALMLPMIYVIQLLSIDSPWLIVPVFASIPMMGLHFALSAIIRCVRCGRLLIVQQSRPRFGEPTNSRSAWGALLRRISKGEDFRCMSCGQRFTTGPR